MTRAVILLAFCLGGCAHRAATSGPAPHEVASGTLRDSAGARVGVATVLDTAGGFRLAVSVGDLTPGLHGIHVHERGECTPPDFASAGPHLNPTHRQHGRLNPEGPHLGDLPNLVVGADGSADTTFALAAELVGSDTGSLLGPGGTAIVVHAQADDERTDPSGNSGARVACAVLAPS